MGNEDDPTGVMGIPDDAWNKQMDQIQNIWGPLFKEADRIDEAERRERKAIAAIHAQSHSLESFTNETSPPHLFIRNDGPTYLAFAFNKIQKMRAKTVGKITVLSTKPELYKIQREEFTSKAHIFNIHSLEAQYAILHIQNKKSNQPEIVLIDDLSICQRMEEDPLRALENRLENYQWYNIRFLAAAKNVYSSSLFDYFKTK